MLTVCREFQILFNETREKALKAVAFSKTLRKDLENGAFKEGISPDCNTVIDEALEKLKVRRMNMLQIYNSFDLPAFITFCLIDNSLLGFHCALVQCSRNFSTRDTP
jgi:hypothetical protein